MNYGLTGNLIPYKASYSNHNQAKQAWKEGMQFVLESKGHCLNGLLVTSKLFDKMDTFRLFLQGNKGKFIQVNGI